MADSVSCDPADLIRDATCIYECVPQGMQMPILISIFCQLADMDCTPASLMTSAACQLQCIPAGMQMPVLISLVCQILNGGGGGGVFCQSNFVGNGDPTGVVFPSCDVAFYTQRDSVPAGVIWNWYDGVWH